MNKKSNIDKEFQRLCVEIGSSYGLDSLPSKIFALLYMAQEELALEDISKKTGYSLATVSKTMKSLVPMLCLNKFRKPKSRKVYFSIEKDMGKLMSRMMKKKIKDQMIPLKEQLPVIIKKNNDFKDIGTKNKIIILKQLYKHIKKGELALKMVSKIMGE